MLSERDTVTSYWMTLAASILYYGERAPGQFLCILIHLVLLMEGALNLNYNEIDMRIYFLYHNYYQVSGAWTFVPYSYKSDHVIYVDFKIIPKSCNFQSDH